MDSFLIWGYEVGNYMTHCQSSPGGLHGYPLALTISACPEPSEILQSISISGQVPPLYTVWTSKNSINPTLQLPQRSGIHSSWWILYVWFFHLFRFLSYFTNLHSLIKAQFSSCKVFCRCQMRGWNIWFLCLGECQASDSYKHCQVFTK